MTYEYAAQGTDRIPRDFLLFAPVPHPIGHATGTGLRRAGNLVLPRPPRSAASRPRSPGQGAAKLMRSDAAGALDAAGVAGTLDQREGRRTIDLGEGFLPLSPTLNLLCCSADLCPAGRLARHVS